MARVVQRRSNPPYALILMVVLFLISAVLNFVLFNQFDAKNQQIEELTKTSRALGGASRGGQEVASMLQSAQTGGQSVIDQLLKQQEQLVNTIAQGQTDPNAAIGAAETATADAAETHQRELTGAAGLVGFVEQLSQELAAAKNQLADQSQEISSLNEQLASREDAVEDLQGQLEDRVQQLNDQLVALQGRFRDLGQEYNQNITAANEESQALISDKNNQINSLLQQTRDLQLQILERDNVVNELRRILAELRPDVPTEPLLTKADGEILRVAHEADVVYINLGSRDRVIAGLPFAVYSQRTGVDPNGEGKAIIRVTSVSDTFAEARIISSTRQDPITEGDLIHNIAFDSQRTYLFAVAGEFDLDGDGTTDPQGAERVADLIRQYGGQVSRDVTVQTDFVVLGAEPVPPLRPGDSAPPSEQELYQNILQEVQRYEAVRELAVNLQIPILNTNRFLAFVGYQPESTEAR